MFFLKDKGVDSKVRGVCSKFENKISGSTSEVGENETQGSDKKNFIY